MGSTLVFLLLALSSALTGQGAEPEGKPKVPLVEKQGRFEVAEDRISLEYAVSYPEKAQRLPGVVVCHPDPRMGGSFHSHVVVALVKELTSAGWIALRFNFRGTGASEGSFADGVGEKRDVQAAIRYLKSLPQVEPKKLFLAGYSFGSGVALNAALDDPGIRAFAGIGYPNGMFKHKDAGKCKNASLPVLVVGGTKDPWCLVESLKKTFAEGGLKAEVRAMEGVDHFFAQPKELAEAVGHVVHFLKRQLGRSGDKSKSE